MNNSAGQTPLCKEAKNIPVFLKDFQMETSDPVRQEWATVNAIFFGGSEQILKIPSAVY